MTIWTVYKVRGLHAGHAGQSLEKIGRVDAADYPLAMETARRRWPNHVDPALPQGGLTVIPART